MNFLARYRRDRRTLLAATRVSLGDGLHRAVAPVGGIYRITKKGKPQESLYIGKAKSLRAETLQQSHERPDPFSHAEAKAHQEPSLSQ